MKFLVTTIIPILFFVSCATADKVKPHERLHSTLWIQESPEFKLISLLNWKRAENLVKKSLEDTSFSAAVEQVGDFSVLPPAVILDVDETVLDNSPYNALIIKNGKDFDLKTWNHWIISASAKALPGAVDFVKKMKELGVKVIFITNRDIKLESYTEQNLESAGFELDKNGGDSLLSRNEYDSNGNDKTARREIITKGYRVIMIAGDDIADFIPLTSQGANFDDSLMTKAEKGWLLFPNPNYGTWMFDIEKASLKPEDKLANKINRLKPATPLDEETLKKLKIESEKRAEERKKEKSKQQTDKNK